MSTFVNMNGGIYTSGIAYGYDTRLRVLSAANDLLSSNMNPSFSEIARMTGVSRSALLLLLLPRRFFVVSLSCGYVIRAHAHGPRHDATRGAVTSETVTAIAEPAETGESSDVRRPGGAARCSAVARGGGGCGMAAAAGRGGRAAVRCFVEVAR